MSPRRPSRGASIPRVVIYTAEGCHLCERALEVVERVCAGDFEHVDIGGDPQLEAAYRQAPVGTFGGGVNEVQREIIALAGLGMPRAPR